MKAFLKGAGSAVVLLIVLMGGFVQAEKKEISVKDVDGVTRKFNSRGRVTVIIYSNPGVQDRTRKAGAALDKFQGKKNFRSIILVDLRKSFADWAPGYTQRRMQRDLNKEAERVRPYYIKNSNSGNPRKDLSAIADFKGEVCKKLGWMKPKDELRVVVFGLDGKEYKRWKDLKKFEQLTKSVENALNLKKKSGI